MKKSLLLTIDSGNTNTVFAVHDGQKSLAQWRIATQNNRTADEYTVWLSQLMHLGGIEAVNVDAAILTTVVPQTLFGLQMLCRNYLGCEPMVVGDPEVALGIVINIEQPHEVGSDRLVNAIGAHVTYQGALIIVDFGTATTFDVVNRNGTYEGGAIAPGVNLSVEALSMAAARLPSIAISRPKRSIGKDTRGAMQSGLYWGYIGLIEGLVSRIQNEFGEDMAVLATGGLAPLFEKGTHMIDTVDADLTTRGLVEIYRRNSQRLH